MNTRAQNPVSLEQALELHRRGDLPAAAEAYARLLEAQPGNYDARYGLGTVRLQQGEVGAARELLEQAVRDAPGVPEYRFNLGFALQRLEQHLAAIEQFEIALAQRPEARTILLALAESLASVRNYPAAARAQGQALALDASRAADHLTHADLLFAAQRPDEARQAIAKARELGDNSPLRYFLEARCERVAGNPDAERQLLQKAIDLRPGYADAWQYLLDLTDDADVQALADDCEGLAGDPAWSARDRLLLRYTLGRAYERLGDHAQAFEHFARANRTQRADAEARGKTYDRGSNERYLDWVRGEFDGEGTTAGDPGPEAQPIFIVGMPRSGTTLVEGILGGLDGVTIGGESEALEFVTTRYFNALARQETGHVRELSRGHWDELAATYWRIQLNDKARVTDRMPTNFRHVGMLARMFPGSVVIHVRRDPRDVALSIFSRPFPDGHPYATDLGDIAHYYAMSLRLMEHWKGVHENRIHELSYASLVESPEVESRKLAEFCGLEWQPSCLDIRERRHAGFAFGEARVREPLNSKGIGRWRNYEEYLAPFIDACAANGVPLQED